MTGVNSDITKELQNDYKTINYTNLNYILIRIKLKISPEK